MSLQNIKIDSLPQNAGAFRSWRHFLVTKLCSRGQDILLEWVLEALDASTDQAAGSSMSPPRIDAYMAALLTEPTHLHGELGVQFQAYVESCQLRRTSPQGREMLRKIA